MKKRLSFLFFSTISAFSIATPRPVELVWILDHSSANERTIQQLKNSLQFFYSDLKNAGISYTGIMLSSDLEKFDGNPIRPAKGPSVLMPGPEELLDFKARTSLAYSDLFCNNCFSSPTWALGRFFEKLKSLNDVYHHSFYMPGVPLEVLFVTSQVDHYRHFSKKSPLKNYGPVDFANTFVDIGAQENKRVRIHALTPECPHLIETSGDPMSVGPQDAYRVLAEQTGGTMISADCEFDPAETLRRYANVIIQEVP